MKTRRELLEALRNREKWPRFKRPDFLDELNQVANKAFSQNTPEGYLASLLIYQQLCEECLRILIETTHFFVQCAVFPSQLADKNLHRMTFGQLIGEYETCVQSKHSQELIRKCKELNRIRTNMVHKITLKSSVSSISRQTKRVQQLFKDILELFDWICDYFLLGLKDYRKDINHLEELLDEAEREEKDMKRSKSQ